MDVAEGKIVEPFEEGEGKVPRAPDLVAVLPENEGKRGLRTTRDKRLPGGGKDELVGEEDPGAPLLGKAGEEGGDPFP